VVSALDEVAWLFNLRGTDIPFNPVFLSYAIVTLDSVSLFTNKTRITSKIREHLDVDSENATLKLFGYEDIQEELRCLGNLGKKIWVSSKSSAALASLVQEKDLFTERSPVGNLKAVNRSRSWTGYMVWWRWWHC